MTQRISYTACPACKSSAINAVLMVKDHSVSGELFELWHCSNCSFRFTQHIPPQEAIGRYYQSDNYISHSNTNKGFVNRLYHFVRKLTLVQKKNLVQKVSRLSTGSLLDLGAGTGAFASCMKQNGWRVTALEPDSNARNIALQTNNISLLSAEHLFELPPESFDAITLWHVLEHVHTLDEYVLQLKKILKLSGRLIIAVPNYTSWDASYYKEYWAAYDVPRHLYHFSPPSMKALLQRHGFVIEKILPMWFDSFYVSMLSEKYKTGSSNLLKGGWIGFLSNCKAIGQKNKCSSVIYVIRKA